MFVNIFFLDEDIQKNVESYCNTHTISQIKELVQILGTALDIHGYPSPVAPTHHNHPCVVYVSESIDNFKYVHALGKALAKEYTYRYNKEHAYEKYLNDMIFPKLRKIGFTEPPQVVSEEFKGDNTIIAYRKYYVYDKLSQKGWRWEYKNRKEPEWIKDYR